MAKNNRDVWAFIESAEGKSLKSSLELLSPAKEICEKTGGSLSAVIFGENIKEEAELLGRYGVDRVIAVEVKEYSCAAYTQIMYRLIKKYQPDAVMFSASHNGKDFVPRLACRLETGVTANCTALDVEPESGLISWMMPAPGGIMATILCEHTRPQMGTVCPGIFKKPQLMDSSSAEIIFEDGSFEADERISLISSEKNENTGIGIEDAEIIVAGGRGLGSKEGFEPLKKLADLLGGALGASRAAVDLEWVGQETLVGQTGKVVHPKLYIACGISGALQHLVGVKADCVVAINPDPKAAIFEIADYGIVGTAENVIPALIKEIEKLKA